MSLLTQVGDFLREGAADVFGFGGELDSLRETAADARMLARSVEDSSGWTPVGSNSAGSYFEPTRESRIATVRRAYRFFFDDVIVRRSVLLLTSYVFSKGVAVPRYRRDSAAGDTDADYNKAQKLIKDLWAWPENKRVITTHKAQKQKMIELMLQANVFILLFRSQGDPDEQLGSNPTPDPNDPGKPQRPTLVLANVKDREIVEIIGHPDNDTIPVFYKRVYTPRVYDFTSGGSGGALGAYKPQNKPVTIYYRDWENEAPDTWGELPDGTPMPWGPPADMIGDGVIYHASTNLVSDMKFGISELRSVLKWSTGLNQFMTSRMMISQAIAAIAMQAKTKGGPGAVNQVAAKLADISRLAGQVEGADSLTRTRADQGSSKIAVTSRAVDLNPMVQDTGAAGAQADASIMMGQAAAGTGVAKQHLGISDTPSLATATSLDMPTQRLAEDWQEMFERMLKEIGGYMLRGEGLDPDKFEVQMPPILSRDVAQVAATLTGLMAAVDPNAGNAHLIRWTFQKVLEALGEINPMEIVDDLFPSGFQTPYQQQQDMMQKQADLAGGQQMGGGAPLGVDSPSNQQQTPTQLAAAGLANAAGTAAVNANNGRRQGLNQPGGPGASLDRAANRVALQLTAPREAISEDEFVDATLGDLGDLPEELQEAAREAVEALASMVAGEE